MASKGKKQSEQRLDPYLSVLRIDLMYLMAAKRALASAKAGWPAVEKELRRHNALHDKAKRIREKNERSDFDQEDRDDENNSRAEPYDLLEPLYIQMESQDLSTGKAYGAVLESLAITQLLCAACLEAHINLVADGHLTGKLFEQFDKLPLGGKWLFLPKILNLKGFSPDAEPFQSFDMIIKWRNALMHYRQKREPWDQKPAPAFFEKLGPNHRSRGKGCAGHQEMVSQLNNQLYPNDDRPWDRITSLEKLNKWTYFDIEFPLERRLRTRITGKKKKERPRT